MSPYYSIPSDSSQSDASVMMTKMQSEQNRVFYHLGGAMCLKKNNRRGKIRPALTFLLTGVTAVAVGIVISFVSPNPQAETTKSTSSKSDKEVSSPSPWTFPENWPNLQQIEPFAETRSIKCPGKILQIVPGGAGRFVIIKIYQPPSLSVFDVNQFAIVKQLPLETPEDLITASRKFIFAINPTNGRCTRWTLNTFQKLPSVDLNIPAPLESVATGSESDGPLVVSRKPGSEEREKIRQGWPSPFIHFLEPESLQKINYKPIITRSERGGVSNSGLINVSPDGKTYSLSKGRTCLRISGNNLAIRRVARGDGPLMTGPNSHVLIDNARQSRYFNWKPTNRSTITDFLPNSDQSLLLEACRIDVTFEGDELRFRSFDIEKTLRSESTPELIFMSYPPLIAFNGETLRHEIKVLTNREEKPTFRLIDAPPGMRLTKDAELIWEVPAGQQKEFVDIGIEARQGKELKRVQWASLFCQSETDVQNQIASPSAEKTATTNEKPSSGNQPAETKAFSSETTPIPSEIARSPASFGKGAWGDQVPNSKLSKMKFDAGKHSIDFPESFLDLVVGGEGRFFVLATSDSSKPETINRMDSNRLNHPKIAKLVIWDLLKLNPVFEIPVSGKIGNKSAEQQPAILEEEILFTAGLRELLIYKRKENTFEFWSLENGKKLNTVPNSLPYTLNAMSMGGASLGPVAIGFYDSKPKPVGFEDVMLIDNHSPFLERRLSTNASGFLMHRGTEGIQIRSAANGSCFSIYKSNVDSSSMEYFLLRHRIEWPLMANARFGHRLPGPDGTWIFTSRGVFETEGQTGLPNPANFITNSFPACSGPWYVDLKSADYEVRSSDAQKVNVTPLLKMNGDRDLSLSLSEIEFEYPAPRRSLYTDWWFPADLRVHLIPWANLLAVIPVETNRIDFYHVDIESHLKLSGKKYLYVSSRPSSHVQTGKRFEYQVETHGSSLPFEFKLESGPVGATINEQGILRWDVPQNIGHNPQRFIVRITDVEKKTLYHNFSCHTER